MSDEPFSQSALEHCYTMQRGEYLFNPLEVCQSNGTLVKPLFADRAGTVTVEERIQPNDVREYHFLDKNISFSQDREGRLLSYANDDNLYSFDPAKQTILKERLEQQIQSQSPFLSLSEDRETPDQSKPDKTSSGLDLGNGLTGTISPDNTITYQLPDNGPAVTVDRYGHVTKILKANEYNYDIKFYGPVEDINAPKDARLHSPMAIHADARYALDAPLSDDALDRFARHVNEMPEPERVEYVRKIQAEAVKVDAENAKYDAVRHWGHKPQEIIFGTNPDSTLKSVSVGFHPIHTWLGTFYTGSPARRDIWKVGTPADELNDGKPVWNDFSIFLAKKSYTEHGPD